MLLPRLRSLLSLLAGATILGSTALATTQGATLGSAVGGAPVVEATPRLADHFVSTCIGYCKHPTNAGKVFRWGLEDWEEEAEGRGLDQRWRSNRPGLVNAQQGMLTIHAKRRTNVVRAWPANNKKAYGRWEARVRAVELETRHKTFQFIWELIPVGGRKTYHCGAQSIVMSSYKPGNKVARGAVRALEDTQFTFSRKVDLRSRAWHTYAVEVTKDRISWFVDTRVVRTEKRDAATTGIRFKPRFRIVGDRDARMNRSMMQMDWVRYYDLDRSNARSVAAPRMTRSTYRGAC